MPFQSEKQRRYLHANHPEIAKRWERDYAGGGRIGFADGPKIPEKFLEDLKRKNFHKMLEEYRRWKEHQERKKDFGREGQNVAQGGRIGFNSGGGKTYDDWLNYRLKQIAKGLLPVPFKEWKKGEIKFKAEGGFIPSHEAGIYGLAEGGRTGFYRGSDRHAGTTSSSSSKSPGHPSNQKSSTTQSTPSKDTSSSNNVGGGDQEDDVAQMMSDMGITPDHSPDYSGDRGWVEAETDYGAGDYSTKSDRAYDFDFMYGHKVKPKDQWTEHNKRNAWIEKKQLGKEMFDAFKFGVGPMSMIKFAWGQNKKKKAEKEHLQKMIDRMKKEGDDQFNPHMDSPLQIAEQLMIDLNTPKKQPDQDNRGDGVTGVASITYDDIEDTNKKELASSRWRQEQEKVDRSKQMAYWRMMMAPYMSAQGGRVPAGYNTGGLSNLFRLKNR
jgi:hypothetical protein